MASLSPVQGDPFADYDPGVPSRDNVVNADKPSQHANREQAQFARQYDAAGGFDHTQPLGSIRNPRAMFPGSADPLRALADGTVKPGDYFIDFHGRMSQISDGDPHHPYVKVIGAPTPVDGDPFAAEPAMGAGEDAARSIMPGVAKGAAGTFGGVGDLTNATGRGSEWAISHGVGGLQDLTGQTLGVPYMGSNELRRHTLSIDRNGAYHDARTGYDPAGPLMNYAHENGQVTSGDLNQGIQNAFGLYHQPQTWAGRSTETLGEMLPNALLPGGAAARGARVVLPAAASSGAGELTQGTPLEPWARAGGALAGAGLEGFGENLGRSPQRVLAQAAPNLTDDQIGLAAALRDTAQRHGINITIPEAVQQVTNGATGLGRVQRLVENTRRTAPAMQGAFANRPDQVRQAVANYIDTLPAGGPDAPGMIAHDAQRSAVGAQMGANSQRLATSRPFYSAADSQAVDQGSMADILQNIDHQISADRTGLVSPVLSRFRDSLVDQPGQAASAGTRVATPTPNGSIYHSTPGTAATPATPITNIGNLSTARNYWRDVIDNPPVGTDALTKYQSGLIGNHLDDLDALLRTNPNRQLGDAAYAASSRSVVDPLNAGPVGKIALSPDLQMQAAALYPRNPGIGAPGETADAISALDYQNPSLGAALTRQHIGSTFNQATRDLSGGPNQYGGALFARNLVGNSEQAATLHAGLNEIDPSGRLSDNLGDLADVLQATGRRERPGSMTAFNKQDEDALKLPSFPVRTLGALADPLEWGKNLSNWSGGRLYNRNFDVLANMIQDPDTAGILQAALRGGPNDYGGATRTLLPALLQLQAQSAQ